MNPESHSQPVDLFVVGGGINGTGIARDAVGRGLSVALCEKDDLAQGTSSRSGKLVHGGLRYLEYYEFRLVREALIEREVLLESAPHIIWPMRFVLPHSKRDRPAWLVRLGLFLYDHLGGRKRLPATRALNLRSAPEGEPLKQNFAKGFEYSDCWVDDARLVLLNALDAGERGATIMTHTRFEGATRTGEHWYITLRQSGGKSIQVQAKALINAAGPWVNDIIDDISQATSNRRVRLVKGSHIIVRKFWQGDQAYLLQNADKRVLFINPYETNYALIGTTDIPQAGSPDSAQVDPAEVNYLLDTVNEYFVTQLSPADVINSFTGVRPLYDDNADNPSAVTRDYVFDLDPASGPTAGGAPLLSVFGGKITTFRKLAEHALDQLQPWFPAMQSPWTAKATLPGGDIENANFESFLKESARRYPWLDSDTLHHLCRCYGNRISIVIGSAGSAKQLGENFGQSFYEAEARYLIKHEWARSADDILQRRTKHGLHLTIEQRNHFAAWCEGKLAQAS